jgi:hypothetical protein
VVDFVEQGAGQEGFAFDFKELAFDILGTDFNPFVALDLLVDFGEAQAAFVFELLAAAIDDFGVDEDDFVFGAFLEADVNYGDLFGDADLRSGEADALRGVHAVEHLVDELGQLGGEVGDGFALFDEDGVGIFYDGVEPGGGLADGVAGGLASEALFRGFIEFGLCRHGSERFYLIAIALVVALEFAEAVASEFFEEAAGDGEGDHGLGGDSGGGDDADVGALVGGFGGFAGFEGDGGEGAAEGRDGLEVAADDEVFAVGDAAFEAAGVVVLAGEAGERAASG